MTMLHKEDAILLARIIWDLQWSRMLLDILKQKNTSLMLAKCHAEGKVATQLSALKLISLVYMFNC